MGLVPTKNCWRKFGTVLMSYWNPKLSKFNVSCNGFNTWTLLSFWHRLTLKLWMERTLGVNQSTSTTQVIGNPSRPWDLLFFSASWSNSEQIQRKYLKIRAHKNRHSEQHDIFDIFDIFIHNILASDPRGSTWLDLSWMCWPWQKGNKCGPKATKLGLVDTEWYWWNKNILKTWYETDTKWTSWAWHMTFYNQFGCGKLCTDQSIGPFPERKETPSISAQITNGLHGLTKKRSLSSELWNIRKIWRSYDLLLLHATFLMLYSL